MVRSEVHARRAKVRKLRMLAERNDDIRRLIDRRLLRVSLYGMRTQESRTDSR